MKRFYLLYLKQILVYFKCFFIQFYFLDNWLKRCGGLDAEVTESGCNFSFGEKQIICLCRLILSKPKVLKKFF